MKKSNIDIAVELDDKNIPQKMQWKASDSPMANMQECSAFVLSLWDGNAKEQLQVHLWTQKMSVEEMNHFFVRSMMGMADTLQRATNNTEDAQKLRDFAIDFGKRNKVLK